MMVLSRGAWRQARICPSTITGFRADAILVDHNDLDELCRLNDRDLVTHLRQLNARVNRAPVTRRSLGVPDADRR